MTAALILCRERQPSVALQVNSESVRDPVRRYLSCRRRTPPNPFGAISYLLHATLGFNLSRFHRQLRGNQRSEINGTRPARPSRRGGRPANSNSFPGFYPPRGRYLLILFLLFAAHQIFTRLSAARTIGEPSGILNAF